MGPNERIKKCYEIESDDQAFSCIRDTVKEVNKSGETCKPKIVLLVQENCGGCDEEKARYRSDIESGIVKQVDMSSDEGRKIAQRNNIEAVPAVLLLDCNDNLID